jgi:hypothetical protein
VYDLRDLNKKEITKGNRWCVHKENALSSAYLCVELRGLEEVSKVLRDFHKLAEVGESLLPIRWWPVWPVRPLCKETCSAPAVYNVVWCFVHAAATLKLGFFVVELLVVPGKISVGCADGYQALEDMSWKCELWRWLGIIGETPISIPLR